MPTQNPRSVFSRTLQVLFALTAAVCLVASGLAAEATKSYSIESGLAATTLKEFAEQSGRSVLFSTEKVQGISTNAIRGELTAEEALDRLLSGTRLSAVPEKSTGGFAIRREVSIEVAEKNVSSRPANSRAADDVQDGVVKLDTFEVFGRKTLNMDIQRTRDDIQPYVIFGREEISRSSATNLEAYLRTRLPMNTISAVNGTTEPQAPGTQSALDLRGLGQNQTLVLVDGRRIPAVLTTAGVGFQQGDINGIPLDAVERVEVLPATASGIYGGGATGGVINIILRRDYQGLDVRASYVNTFDTDTAERRLDINAGLSLEDGRSRVRIAYARSDANSLERGDRDFAERSRDLQLANNPILFTTATPPLGATANIRAVGAANLVLDLAYGGTPLNSRSTHIPLGYAGPASDNGTALVANAGRYDPRVAGPGIRVASSRFGLVFVRPGKRSVSQGA